MDITSFIQENLVIIVAVLYVIGLILRNLEMVPNKYIPVILLIISVAFCVALNGYKVESIIQGIIISGATVLTNQIWKQSQKEE